VLSALFAPIAVFDKFEFVGSVGFIFFGKIILSAAFGATKGNQDPGRFFRFGHRGIIN
jgi:hypothetical protein